MHFCGKIHVTVKTLDYRIYLGQLVCMDQDISDILWDDYMLYPHKLLESQGKWEFICKALCIGTYISSEWVPMQYVPSSGEKSLRNSL